MAIRTFSAQQRYSRNRGEETETNKKLKKVRSVKVANLDRLRLSMRRQKSRFDRSFMAVSDDASNPSGTSSSPNYMKATSSSSARKGSSSLAISSNILSSSAASSSDASSSARNFQVENIRTKKSLKRVSSVRHVSKLSSMKSMKIRAKYSQFQECYNDDESTMGKLNYVNDDQGSIVRDEDGRKSILKRSRSIKLTKHRSIRYSRRLPKSRLGGLQEQMSYGETSNETPHYMRGTSSHEARKNSAKGLTRTSSRRPLRILAKIPSLKPRKNQVRKRPQITPLYHTGVNRATCSSTLKRTEFPDHIELLSGGQESEGASFVHICPYLYCSLNGHHHHAPSLPIKEFISAKRKSLKKQKEKQLREDVKHVISTCETDQSRQMIFTKIEAFQRVSPTPEEEDDGQDFLITVNEKPRKKWDIEGKPSSDPEAFTGFTDNKTSETDYDWELPETKGKQEALKVDQEVPQGIFGMCDVEDNHKNQQEMSTITSNGANESLFICDEKIPSSGSELINILSDNQKYTNIWHLIYQQFASSDASKTGTEGISAANEKESGDVYTSYKGNGLDQEQIKYSKTLNGNDDNQEEDTENPDFDQNAALKLVQEGLNAILERDAEPVDKKSKPDSLAREYNSIPDASTRENITLGERTAKAEMPGQKMSDGYRKLRKIFVTAKIIKAMERMKRISPREPQYLIAEPTVEREKVYLRHLSMKEMKNTEEWKLDYALRWAISKLGPDQQRRVAQLVEAFETVTPELRKDIRHYPMKGKPLTTGDLDIPVDEDHEQTMNILHGQVNLQQYDESLQSNKSGPEKYGGAQEDHARETDSPLESSGNSCIPVDIQVYDEGVVKEHMSIPEDPSQFSTRNSDVSDTGEMSMMFLNKQKYSCMWNLIYQQVVSSETSMDRDQGEDELEKEEKQDEAIRCKEISCLESTTSSYRTNPKEDEDNQNKAIEMKESDRSAAVKLVKEALDAILKRYEQPSEIRRFESHTGGSLRENGRHAEKHANPEEEEKLGNTTDSHQQQVGPNESKNPPREKSKSYNRLKKAFVTAKFINAMQRLRKNSPRKSQSLPSEAGFKEERIYLRHLSIDGWISDEECMLDYALRNVISKMAPDQQRRVAKLVEAFETVTPQQKEMGLVNYPSRIVTAPMARSATNTIVSLKNWTEKMHQGSISDEQDYQVPQNQDNGILLSTKGTSHEKSLEEDHEPKASTAGHETLEKTVEAANSETITELSQISSILTPPDIATEATSTRVEETMKDNAGTVSCFPTEGSEVNSKGDIATILFDKQKYRSMWHLIHHQVVSSEAAKIQEQDINKDAEKECREIIYPDWTQISGMEKVKKDNDRQSLLLSQSAAIKLVKDAIDAILQSHDQRFDQNQYDDKAMNRAEDHGNPRSEDNLHEEDNKIVEIQEKSEEKAAQRKIPNSHSKLKRIFVTAKFIAAMERLKKNNWSKPRHLPAEAASVNERVNLRHLSIDGRKNHEEWMLDYALRHVISSLAPDQQRKVASLVGAFETVIPERTRNGFKYQTKDECSPIKAEPIESEKEIVESEVNDMVYDGHRYLTQGDRLSLNKCGPLEENQQEDCQTDTSSIKTELSSEALDSNKIYLDIQHQASSKGCLVQDPLTVRTDADASIFRTPQHASSSEKHQRDFKHNSGQGIFSDKQKTNSMWHLICQHLQSVEGGSKPNEGLTENDHMKRDGTSLEAKSDDNYDDNDTDASSVTSELTENDAIKLVKETIDDILEGPQELDSELISSLSASSLEKNQTGQKLEKSKTRGYSKLRHLIICNKFIKTMQKLRKTQPQKQMIPALYSGLDAEKARHKSSGKGEKKDTDEWMLDNVLQKVISGLAPAKQRRVALLVEAFEKVNPEQEERGTKLICMKKEYADAISLEGQGKENGITVVESSQNSSESPNSRDLELDGLVTTSNMKFAIDKDPQDISDGRNPSFKIERSPNKDKMKGDTLLTSSNSPQDPTEVSSGDKQKVTLSDQGASLSDALKDEGIYRTQKSTSLDKGNNTSLWGLILQHVKTDIPDIVEMQLSDDIDIKGNWENSSRSPQYIQDKEVDIPNPTRHEVYESEAIKLVQEAVNELLTLPEQEDDYQSVSTSTIPEQPQVETLIDNIATPEEEKTPPKEGLPNSYSKMSRVIMCRRFIKAMSKMRQLKPLPLQEDSDTTHTETKGSLSLRQTEIGEKKSWEEGMLDHALQQVVGKLAPAQKKRVSLLVQAFETVGSQPESTAGQRAKAAFW